LRTYGPADHDLRVPVVLAHEGDDVVDGVVGQVVGGDDRDGADLVLLQQLPQPLLLLLVGVDELEGAPAPVERAGQVGHRQVERLGDDAEVPLLPADPVVQVHRRVTLAVQHHLGEVVLDAVAVLV
jgi:hypothetical protein